MTSKRVGSVVSIRNIQNHVLRHTDVYIDSNAAILLHLDNVISPIYRLGMLTRKGLPKGTVRYLVQSHRPTPGSVIAKMAVFSCEKSIPGKSTDPLDFS